MRKVLTVVPVIAILVSVGPAAHAEETVCRRTIGDRALDNVRVPDGATCTLEGTTVEGTIKIESDGVLVAIGVDVIGNVQGEDARNVVVRGRSSINGDVQVVQGMRGRVVNSEIGGDILYDEQGGRVVVRNSRIGGDVQAFQNSGGVLIADNVIDGNLQCKENDPRPTGGDNRVEGNKEDQCRRL
jgi:hypothetical protein